MNVQVAVPISTIMTAEVITLKANDSLDKAEHLLRLQITWAAGPHKHERY